MSEETNSQLAIMPPFACDPVPLRRAVSDPVTSKSEPLETRRGTSGLLRSYSTDGGRDSKTGREVGRYPHLHSLSGNISCSRPTPVTPLGGLRSSPIVLNVAEVFTNLNKLLTESVYDSNNDMSADVESGLVSSGSNTENEFIETFYCTICYENHALENAFRANECGERHTYCIPCMSSYATIQVGSRFCTKFNGMRHIRFTGGGWKRGLVLSRGWNVSL